jgi:glyoxalase family protein
VTTVQPLGLHHVTAIASDPQRNLDFWSHVLGQRLVKQTVNFDAPDVYHLYYGNEAGDPGTVMTFFPWPGAARGRLGAGQTTVTSYSVPEGSIGWWRTHLAGKGVEVEELTTRFEEDALRLRDPDGLVVELIAHEGGVGAPWGDGPIPVEHTIRGFHSVTLTESSLDGTSGIFLDTMNFDATHEHAGRYRFEVGEGGLGRSVDVVVDPSAPRGLVASGTVHHIAWRTSDEETQLDWRSQIVETGTQVTDVLDRQYFRSIYFREPGGVLLEIATDPPGFTADEPLLALGRELKLPPWLEPSREAIAARLPSLKLPEEDA